MFICLCGIVFIWLFWILFLQCFFDMLVYQSVMCILSFYLSNRYILLVFSNLTWKYMLGWLFFTVLFTFVTQTLKYYFFILYLFYWLSVLYMLIFCVVFDVFCVYNSHLMVVGSWFICWWLCLDGCFCLLGVLLLV